MQIMMFLSDIMIPLLIFLIIGYGLLCRHNIYEEFIEGAKDGFETVIGIMPTLIGLMVAVGILRASGFLECFSNVCAIFTEKIGFPSELLPLAVVKMFSSSAATGLLLDIYKEYGTDSLLGRMASIMLGSTETIFYTMSVYFMSVKIKKSRYTLAGALAATAAGMAASVVLAGMITRELLVALRTDLTQVVYAWLSEREIKAYALFADADMENLHRNSLYGREEMMEYAGVLVRKAVQYRQYINKSDSVTSQVCAYIDAHYREEIHREELGELVFLNTDYLSRIFKKEKGISISNYIIQKRVEEAKKLLTQSTLPINTVSLYVGYSNFSYFTKMFKDNTGYAPLEYRRSFSEK